MWVFFMLCFIFTHFFCEQTTDRDVDKPLFPTPCTEDAPAVTGRRTTKRGAQRSYGSNDKLDRRATTSVTPAQTQIQARAQHAKKQAQAEHQRQLTLVRAQQARAQHVKAQRARAEYQRQLASMRARLQEQAQKQVRARLQARVDATQQAQAASTNASSR